MFELRDARSLSNHDSCAKCDAYFTLQRFGRRSDGLTSSVLLILPDIFVIRQCSIGYAPTNRHTLAAGRVGPEHGLEDVFGPAGLVT